VPLPRRPAQLQAEGQLNAVALQWQAAVDCNDQPVAGYNLYRATSPGGPYEKVNTDLLTETGYLDTAQSSGIGTALAAASLQTDTPYYYVVKAVDADGDESVSSAEISAVAASPAPDTLINGNGRSKACFVQTAQGAIPGNWMVIGFIFAIAVIFGAMRKGIRWKECGSRNAECGK